MTYKERDYKLFLVDMIEASDKILEYTKNCKDYQNFIAEIKIMVTQIKKGPGGK